jgi:hypothetical protein
MNIEQYIEKNLKHLKGTFNIYKNKNNKYLHISTLAGIYVDTNFWKFIKQIEK